jgi:integrase/recombinase XerD
MSPLAQAVEEYLELRRALGYKLKLHGLLLPQFVEFLERRGASLITTELALEWAGSVGGTV